MPHARHALLRFHPEEYVVADFARHFAWLRPAGTADTEVGVAVRSVRPIGQVPGERIACDGFRCGKCRILLGYAEHLCPVWAPGFQQLNLARLLAASSPHRYPTTAGSAPGAG